MNTTSKVPVELDGRLFQRLQCLAVPLVDDTNSVIDRLLRHWEKNPPEKSKSATAVIRQFWVSPRGERFLIGTKLRGNYSEQEFQAFITEEGILFKGQTYSSPSAAAIAAKKSAGLAGKSATTNGWKFWQFFDEETQRWRSIKMVRRNSR